MLLRVSPDFTRYRRGAGVAVPDARSVASTTAAGDATAVAEAAPVVDARGANAGTIVEEATPASDGPGVPRLKEDDDCDRAITRTRNATTISPTRTACPPLFADAVGSAPIRRAGSRTSGG